MSASLAVFGHEETDRGRARGLNSRHTLFASRCWPLAAEVNRSHVLIVLWSRHGALAPRRVKLTKVKSAGSIKAHLGLEETPARLLGCGRASSHTPLFTASNSHNNTWVTDNLSEKQELWREGFNLARSLAQIDAGPSKINKLASILSKYKHTSKIIHLTSNRFWIDLDISVTFNHVTHHVEILKPRECRQQFQIQPTHPKQLQVK